MKHALIPEYLLVKIGQYLGAQPFNLVEVLIAEIRNCKMVEAKPAEKEKTVEAPKEESPAT